MQFQPLLSFSKTSLKSFKISFAPLSVEDLYRSADCSANGAIVLMSGMVREQTQGRPVIALEYQAYEPMALKIFEQISNHIRKTWPDITRVVIHHRIGRLSVGEISVLVAMGSPHRAEAFSACQYAIDTLKHEAPIWKKEHWLDGSVSLTASKKAQIKKIEEKALRPLLNLSSAQSLQ